MRFGVSAVILSLVLFAAAAAEERVLELSNGETIRYRVVEGDLPSARPVALQLIRHLARGEVEAAARLSNAPQRRYEVLREHQASVGEEEFKRLYARFFEPENRVLLEAAIGPRRLVIWELGEAGHRLAGQFFVEAGGQFVLDDMPSQERAQLERILDAYRERSAR